MIYGAVLAAIQPEIVAGAFLMISTITSSLLTFWLSQRLRREERADERREQARELARERREEERLRQLREDGNGGPAQA